MLFTRTEYHNNTVPYLLMQVYRSYTYITGKGTLSSLTPPPAGRLSSFMGCCFFHVDIADHYLRFKLHHLFVEKWCSSSLPSNDRCMYSTSSYSIKNIFYCRAVSQSVNLDELSNRSQDLEAASRYLSAALLTSNMSQGNLFCLQLPVKLACFHSLNALAGVRLSVRSAH